MSSKCIVCDKTAYPMESTSVDGKVMHEKCFKCSHCKKRLTPGTYAGMNGVFYCKPHFKQLFQEKGNYNEGFGEDKLTSKWAPQTGGFEGTK